MHLRSLQVVNFRGITNVELEDLGAAVVLAGPNGCGKSCVLDAIRLLKSAYGSYEQDEFNMWLGEFQINTNQSAGEFLGLLQNKGRPLRVEGKFVLSTIERRYLSEHAENVIEENFWRQADPGRMRGGGVKRSFSSIQRVQNKQLQAVLSETMPAITSLLSEEFLLAAVEIRPDGKLYVADNRLLELIFSTYMPQQIGVIDYHGPNRTYNRSKMNSVNLTIEASETQQRQHALYNSANKYANLKTEMTSAYVRNLLAAKADPTVKEIDQLTATLKELFTTFFPGKEFLGPQPTAEGHLTFLVRLSSGATHDIDELSSGEKEVVYGYLRLHSAAPLNSMIMIDEPELHLNPRLIGGLAAFYYRHLAAKHGNQLWLVSHSDTLIREAVAHPSFSVFHIQPPPSLDTGESQATAVKAKGDLEKVVLALVGDLAAYRPGQKIVIFESTEDASFDLKMTCTLFPVFEQKVNAISAGNKKRVSDLYDLLEGARGNGQIDTRFFAIYDADGDEDIPSTVPTTRYCWDVYHIENYLLDAKFILQALRSIGAGTDLRNENDVVEELKKCAGETVNGLVAHKLRVVANKQLVSAINLGFDPRRNDVVAALSEAIDRSAGLIQSRVCSELAKANLLKIQRSFEEEYRTSLLDASWLSKFRGRDLLKRLVSRHGKGVPYERLRDLIINKMAEAHYQPLGMARVINQIVLA